LHLHLEGCLSAARALSLWNDAIDVAPPPPPDSFLRADGKAFVPGPRPPADLRWHYPDLMGFLIRFAWATRFLREARIYVQLLDDVCASLRRQRIEYAELFVAIGQMQHADIDPNAILPALALRAREIEVEGGPKLYFIADATRQWGVSACERVLESALRLQEHRIVGFGIGGDERAVRAREFKRIYRRAAAAGLGLTCHAGEGTTADAVREVVEELGVARVGHGIAAAQDPRLMRELAEAGIVLEICPTSNLKTGAWDAKRGTHPIFALDAAGVPIVLGSDDPAFFDCDLRSEERLLRSWGMSEARLEHMRAVARRNRFAA
jgi:adenosine deaminase